MGRGVKTFGYSITMIKEPAIKKDNEQHSYYTEIKEIFNELNKTRYPSVFIPLPFQQR